MLLLNKLLGGHLDAQTVFQNILEKYPEKIRFSGSKLHENGGATIPDLIAAHDESELSYGVKSIEYQAMGWSIFQSLHQEAKLQIESGGTCFHPQELCYSAVKTRYSENMSSIRESQDDASS